MGVCPGTGIGLLYIYHDMDVCPGTGIGLFYIYHDMGVCPGIGIGLLYIYHLSNLSNLYLVCVCDLLRNEHERQKHQTKEMTLICHLMGNYRMKVKWSQKCQVYHYLFLKWSK